VCISLVIFGDDLGIGLTVRSANAFADGDDAATQFLEDAFDIG